MKNIYFIALFFTSLYLYSQPCYNENLVTSAYATGGTGLYKNEILWLTWGGRGPNGTNLYGTPGVDLADGAKSYASIPLGNEKFLCVEATIQKITSNGIKSYKPGTYVGDSKDDWYNIGGTDNNNQLISGIINSVDGQTAHFKLICKASISGMPVRLKAVVIADAESIDPDNEYIRGKAKGKWKVLEVKKNIGSGAYYVRKDDVNNIIQFGVGNNKTTAALAMLRFNNDAYVGNDYEVTTEIAVKGSGLQAISLGLVTPEVDFGDAPDYYGFPVHTLEKLDLSADNINALGSFNTPNNLTTGTWTNDGDARRTNINTNAYQPAVILNSPISYLGSERARHNVFTSLYDVHGVHADKDGYGTNEEDAWPEIYSRFSYKANFYIPGETVEAIIPYYSETDGYVTAWIDLNGDGKFGSGTFEDVNIDGNGNITKNANTHPEFTFVKVNRDTHGLAHIQWVVPKNRVNRNTYVRLRIGEFFNEISSPVSATINGEVEDHKIFIIAPTTTNSTLLNRVK